MRHVESTPAPDIKITPCRDGMPSRGLITDGITTKELIRQPQREFAERQLSARRARVRTRIRVAADRDSPDQIGELRGRR